MPKLMLEACARIRLMLLLMKLGSKFQLWLDEHITVLICFVSPMMMLNHGFCLVFVAEDDLSALLLCNMGEVADVDPYLNPQIPEDMEVHCSRCVFWNFEVSIYVFRICQFVCEPCIYISCIGRHTQILIVLKLTFFYKKHWWTFAIRCLCRVQSSFEYILTGFVM